MKRQLKLFITLFSISLSTFLLSITLTAHFSFLNFHKPPPTVALYSNYNSIYQMGIENTPDLSTFFVNKGKTVYFTFDDGPGKYTDDILNILEEEDIEASFFLLERNIVKYPDIINRMIRNNHSIGCHGVTHKVSSFYKSPDSALNEMQACQNTLFEVTGEKSHLIRVPFGSYPYLTKEYKNILEENGFIIWDWNIDSYDWKSFSAKDIAENVIEQLLILEMQNQTPAILFHEKEITAKSLPAIISFLKQNGYQFKAITEQSNPIAFNINF